MILTFWSKPLKINEYQMAKKQSKNPDDLLESTARLFIKKAVDANGVPQYQIDALPVIMGALSMETAGKLLGAMNDSDEEEEAVELDFKSPEEAPTKEHVLLHELHVAKGVGDDTHPTPPRDDL